MSDEIEMTETKPGLWESRLDYSKITDEELLARAEAYRQRRRERFRNENLPLLTAIGLSIVVAIVAAYWP